MSAGLDEAGTIRVGEEIDLISLDAWLKSQLPQLRGKPKVTQYSGGASNWTYRIEYENDDLILRRPPAGSKSKSAHDMGREYRLQQALRPHFPLVPEMRVYCDDTSIIGTDFYTMQRLVGIIPRRNLPRGIDLDPAQVKTLCSNVIDTLVKLHQVDVDAAGLRQLGTGSGFARRQVDGWSQRYREARTWNVPRSDRIMDWLKTNLPSERRLCVTHNDFRFDNVVLAANDPTRVVGVLDWELATLGDPLMDLGNMLSYWVQADDDWFAKAARRQPTHLTGMLTRAEVLAYYCEKTGSEPENWAFYEVFGLFRLSAILQQIYYRYHHRQTLNPAFRRFWMFVHYLHHRCRRAMAGAS
jgi:aminoglycoside phosphotransferase (APT) family kinase protein